MFRLEFPENLDVSDFDCVEYVTSLIKSGIQADNPMVKQFVPIYSAPCDEQTTEEHTMIFDQSLALTYKESRLVVRYAVIGDAAHYLVGKWARFTQADIEDAMCKLRKVGFDQYLVGDSDAAKIHNLMAEVDDALAQYPQYRSKLSGKEISRSLRIMLDKAHKEHGFPISDLSLDDLRKAWDELAGMADEIARREKGGG